MVPSVRRFVPAGGLVTLGNILAAVLIPTKGGNDKNRFD